MEKCAYCDRNYPILKTDGEGNNVCTMCAGIDMEGNVIRGAITPIRVEKVPGRNDPCPCGSGKKYKKCCITSK